MGLDGAELELATDALELLANVDRPDLEVDVTKRAYRKGEEPKIQVTADRKVMVRSLVEAGGLASYKMQTQLSRHVPFEQARTAYSGGRKADFARAEDLIAGIEAMQQERQAAKRKIDSEWEQIHDWLVRTFGPARG